MNPGPSRYRLQERREPGSESLDSEDSQTNRGKPSYLDPWIVTLLLEYKEPEPQKDGQVGHVLKVLNDASALSHDEECPAAILCIGDGHHYIQTVITAPAAQMPTCGVPQSGFSGLVGQFIILQNYRVCFKEASKMEDCEFYIILDCFRVMPLNRQATKQHDCNQEPSVLQKIKELWQKRLALQPWLSSESASISEALKEIKEDRLSTLKQNVKDCLSVLSHSNELDSEQLAVYPETKWQTGCKQDKIHQDIFTVPAKFLAISAENKKALDKSYSPKISQVPGTDDSTEDEDCSTISFFSAPESNNLDDSLENPWDVLPGLTLNSSSDSADTLPGLPPTQQMLLASTAEKKGSSSSSCTPEFLEPCPHTSHCNSEQIEPVVTVSPAWLPSRNVTTLKESVSQEFRAQQIHITHNSMADTDESVPYNQPLRNSPFPTTLALSSAHPPSKNDVSLELLCENTEENHTDSLQMMERRAWDEIMETDRRGVAVKRKQMMADDGDKPETFFISTCTRQKALELASATVSPQSNKLDKLPAWKPPLTFTSTPKKSRTEEIHVQQHPVPTHLRRSDRLLRKGRKQGGAEGATRNVEQQFGIQQQECVRGVCFNHTYKSSTPELCAQICSTRISRALLEWACWVLNNMQD
uniref:Adrenocortical dysplasia protein homolog n=1 Tax=Pogona vitticeps TaxID=103695 RepID=A0A6J0V6I3_9SAUR